MRARKRNPFWGQGLDKRQARRARRRAAAWLHFRPRVVLGIDQVPPAGFPLDRIWTLPDEPTEVRWLGVAEVERECRELAGDSERRAWLNSWTDAASKEHR